MNNYWHGVAGWCLLTAIAMFWLSIFGTLFLALYSLYALLEG